MGVTYFVNPAQFAQHPIYESYIRANPHLGFTSSHEPGSAAYRNDLTKFIRLPQQVTSEGGTAAKVNTPANLAKFERTVERSYIHQLQQICRQEVSFRFRCSAPGVVASADSLPPRLCLRRTRRSKTVTSAWIEQKGSSASVPIGPKLGKSRPNLCRGVPSYGAWGTMCSMIRGARGKRGWLL